MDAVAWGFWGAFFGAAALMLAGAVAAFARADRRVGLGMAVPALGSALYVAAYLGWLPPADRDGGARVAAHVAIVTAVLLWIVLLLDLGLLRERRARRRALVAAAGALAVAVAVNWMLDAHQSRLYGALLALGAAVAALPLALHSARRGDRDAWFGVGALGALVAALGFGVPIALDRDGVGWPVHAATAVAATVYLCCAAAMVWARYSYLLEVRAARVSGPSYDPVTRLPANAATGSLLARALRAPAPGGRPVLLMAVAIGNLYALENLHGRAALNHALFVTASRLRRCVPAHVEVAKLFEEGFLLVARGGDDMDGSLPLAHLVAQRLAKPIVLPAPDGAGPDTHWAAQVGVGVLATSAPANPAAAVAAVRRMARTAWSFPSRVARQQAPDGTPSAWPPPAPI